MKLTSLRGAELYIPPWFHGTASGYDLVVHFHGLGKIQEANIERVSLNAAIASINLGAGTTPYGKPFRRKETFAKLLSEIEAAIAETGRVAEAPRVRRMAFSAWSAGYVSIARVMQDPEVARRIDAILLADGFFTAFTNMRKRTVDETAIRPFAEFAAAAGRGERLFAITHTTIPTGPFPSVQECVAKLLAMAGQAKTPASGLGPRDMRRIYVVDNGSFHVQGFEGRTARDHVNQAHAMGETLFPYLKERWEREDSRAPTP